MLKFDHIRYGTICVKSDEKVAPNRQKEVHGMSNENSHLFVCETNIPSVYNFGAMNLKPDNFGHDAGYVWSSRVGVLNKEFGTDFVEVYVNNYAGYCMSVNDLKRLMPAEYSFKKVIRFESQEPYYEVVDEVAG